MTLPKNPPRGFFQSGEPWVAPAATRGGLSLAEAEAKARDDAIGKTHARCTVCAHVERHKIEALRVGGAGLEELATRFGVHKDSLWRHMKNHVSPETKVSYLAGPSKLNELANLAADENKGLLEYLGILRSILFGQLDRSAQRDKPYEVSLVGGKVLDTLREIGRLTGEVSAFTSQTLNITTNNSAVVMNSPFVAELQAELLQTLAPFPEARQAVISMFVRLDDRHRQPEMKLVEHEPISRSEAIRAGHAAKRERMNGAGEVGP
jgi:hypothetical protein